jgi:hypothetical protein
MHRSEISQTIYFRCPGAGPRASIETKGEYASMKKIFKNIVAYFALYGEQINSWNAII